MNKLLLHNTDLEVSCMSLGTGNYGTSVVEEKAVEQLNRYISKGGNFLDTAHVYGDWIPGELARSEKVIGRWMKAEGNRDKVIVSTKGGHPLLESMNVSRLSNDEIIKDMDESLLALQTDYIDLYFLHRDDESIPASVLVDVLEDQVKAGKIRYYGCSNWSLKRVKEAADYAKSRGYKGFVCNQILHCLPKANKEVLQEAQMLALDKEFHEYHCETGLGLMAYMSIGNGYFIKKIEGSPVSKDLDKRFGNDISSKIFEYLKEQGVSAHETAVLSYQYVLEQSFASVAIASFSSMAQLEEGIRCCEEQIVEDMLNQVRKYRKF